MVRHPLPRHVDVTSQGDQQVAPTPAAPLVSSLTVY